MKRLHKLLLLALGLILVAVVVNLTDPTHSLTRLVKGETKLQAQYAQHLKPGKPIAPVGSAKAKVKITLLAQLGNHCHEPSITFLKKVAGAAPSHVRVAFVESSSKEGIAARQKGQIDCDTGILINGQGRFERNQGGNKVPVSFRGPVGGGTSASDLAAVIEQELRKQYGKAVTKQELAKLAVLAKGTPGPGSPMNGPDLLKGTRPGSRPANGPASPAGNGPTSHKGNQPASH